MPADSLFLCHGRHLKQARSSAHARAKAGRWLPRLCSAFFFTVYLRAFSIVGKHCGILGGRIKLAGQGELPQKLALCGNWDVRRTNRQPTSNTVAPAKSPVSTFLHSCLPGAYRLAAHACRACLNSRARGGGGGGGGGALVYLISHRRRMVDSTYHTIRSLATTTALWDPCLSPTNKQTA